MTKRYIRKRCSSESVDELHKRLKDIADTMHVVAEKTIDASDSLIRSGDIPSTVTTDENRDPTIRGPKSPGVEGVSWLDAGSSETLIYWESRGGFYRAEFLRILNTAARELDDHCIILRNTLSLGSRVLDEQQATIVSNTLRLVSPVRLRTDRIIYIVN